MHSGSVTRWTAVPGRKWGAWPTSGRAKSTRAGERRKSPKTKGSAKTFFGGPPVRDSPSDCGPVLTAGGEGGDFLSLEGEVWRARGVGSQAAAGGGDRQLK